MSDCIFKQLETREWKCKICNVITPPSNRPSVRNCKPVDEEAIKRRREFTEQRKIRLKYPCVYRGPKIGENECPSCCGNSTRIFLFSCAIKGSCMIDAPAAAGDEERCVDCNSYERVVE